jgi:Lon protease-like protein
VAADDDVIALFPLGLVLLPTFRLPLRVFESRYRQMVADLTGAAGGGSFGVIALTRGFEVNQRDIEQATETAAVGTLAEIVQLNRHEDGSADLLTVGSRRFRIRQLLRDRPYLRAHVEFLDEPEGDVRAAHVTAVRELAGRYGELIEALSGDPYPKDAEPMAEDAWLLSYRLAARLPLPMADRQALLELPTTANRLVRLAALLRRELALLQRTRTVAVRPSVLTLGAGPN